MVAADVNGDGKPDLISANYNTSSVSVWTNNGSQGLRFVCWTISGNPSTGPNPHRVTVADLNGDGKPDVIVANASIHQLTLLTNNGSGTFGAYASVGVDSGGAGDVVMADVNGDGRPDLVSANNTANTLTVITNSKQRLCICVQQHPDSQRRHLRAVLRGGSGSGWRRQAGSGDSELQQQYRYLCC